MGARMLRQALAALLLAMLSATDALATGAGVVTGVSGQVTVARATTPSLPLKFKDEVFLRDRISTAEHSLARLLLDQKALLTVRELSELEITEEAGRSAVNLEAGKIAIGVARQRMRPGEVVEIRTQNAVAAIRGTVVVAENLPVPPGSPPQSRIHVLSGYVDITPRNNPGAPPVRMVAPASIAIDGQSVGVPVTLTETAHRQLLSDLHQMLPQHLDAMKTLTSGEFARASLLARIITGPAGSAGEKGLEAPVDPSTTPGKAPITPPTAGVTVTVPSDPQPLFAYTDQTVRIAGDLYHVPPPATQGLSTDLLRAAGSALTIGGDILDVRGSLDSATSRAFVGLDGSRVTAQTLARLDGGTVTLTGTLLDAVNSAFTVRGRALLDVLSNASLVSLGSSPLASFTDGFLVLAHGANGLSFASGATATLGGGLFRSDGTGVTGLGDLVSVRAATLSIGQGGPALDFHDAVVIGLDPGSVGAGGRLDMGAGFARVSGGTLFAPDHVLKVSAGHLTNAGTASLLDFSHATVRVGLFGGGALFRSSAHGRVTDTTGQPLARLDGGSLALAPSTTGFLVGDRSRLDLQGGLLEATDATITSSDDFVRASGRGRIVQSASTAPLVSFTGGTQRIATAGSIVHLDGTASAFDPTSGVVVGTEQPLASGGALLDLAGARVTARRAVTVDLALLEATAPLLQLRADGNGNGATLATGANTLDLTTKAKVDSTATLFTLDRSRLVVNNAALAAVAAGSYLHTAGDFVSLANGSTLTINNGVLLFASGGAIVNIRGALIAFSGTPGNTVSVSNQLAFVNIGGIPVALTGGARAGNVLISGSQIKNAGLGSVTPNKALIRVDGAATRVTISGN